MADDKDIAPKIAITSADSALKGAEEIRIPRAFCGVDFYRLHN